MLIGVGGNGPHANLHRLVDGPSYEMRPIESKDDAESGHQSSTKLVELIVLANSPDCPHPSLRKPDGNFYTGDLFEEVAPGLYANRGRDDDWIKSENALRCDTRFVKPLNHRNIHLGLQTIFSKELSKTTFELHVQTSSRNVSSLAMDDLPRLSLSKPQLLQMRRI